MPEPTTTSTATIASAAVALPIAAQCGIALGLRPDFLVAGFSGALAAIVLLNTVPSSGDTWAELMRTTMRRVFVVIASSLTAGYITPLVLVLLATLPDSVSLGCAFGVGAGAQRMLVRVITKLSDQGAAP